MILTIFAALAFILGFKVGQKDWWDKRRKTYIDIVATAVKLHTKHIIEEYEASKKADKEVKKIEYVAEFE